MERGVYFDAWFPRQHCYHPSLPPRRLTMVDDLAAYHATSLVWSALGGGSISLPYLEAEAHGEIDPRFRFYGFVNDAEFIRACRARGIKVFGIVFEVQGWDFPAELSDDEDRVLALNELRGEGRPARLGLRAFSQNRYPKLWKPVEHYFPDGLVNSLGEPVDDLLEECVSRDIHGAPCHARWVEVPDRGQECWLMDRNNPVWREYLRAVIRIQIDAGVDGVQLDEAETPLTALQYGGCFCRDCMTAFRAHVQADPPAELAGTDLGTFHYGEWLRERGWDFQARRDETPLFWDLPPLPAGADHAPLRRPRPVRPRVRRRAGPRGPRLGQLLQPLRPLLPARARGRRGHHGDAEHHVPAARLVPLRGGVRRRQARDRGGEPVRRRGPRADRGARRRARARPLPHVALRGGRARREHERPVRLVDGRRDRGRVLRAARPVRRDPVLPGRARGAVRAPDVVRGGGRLQHPLRVGAGRARRRGRRQPHERARRGGRPLRPCVPRAERRAPAVRRRVLPRRRAAPRHARAGRPGAATARSSSRAATG